MGGSETPEIAHLHAALEKSWGYGWLVVLISVIKAQCAEYDPTVSPPDVERYGPDINNNVKRCNDLFLLSLQTILLTATGHDLDTATFPDLDVVAKYIARGYCIRVKQEGGGGTVEDSDAVAGVQIQEAERFEAGIFEIEDTVGKKVKSVDEVKREEWQDDEMRGFRGEDIKRMKTTFDGVDDYPLPPPARMPNSLAFHSNKANPFSSTPAATEDFAGQFEYQCSVSGKGKGKARAVDEVEVPVMDDGFHYDPAQFEEGAPGSSTGRGGGGVWLQ